jgi:hippurate hydrolase
MTVRDRCVARIQALVHHIAEAHGAKAEVTLRHGYPVTMNHPEATEFFRKVAQETIGAENVEEMPRAAMGGEDFSFYQQRVPGVFFMLGMGDRVPLHHPQYDFNDEAIETGIRLFVATVEKFLAEAPRM